MLFFHVFLFFPAHRRKEAEKQLVRAFFNFPVQIKLFSGRQLNVARKIEIVGRTKYFSMDESGWQGGKCILASELHLHGKPIAVVYLIYATLKSFRGTSIGSWSRRA